MTVREAPYANSLPGTCFCYERNDSKFEFIL